MVNCSLIKTEPIIFLLVGETHSTGFTNLTPLVYAFLMTTFDKFILKLIVVSDAKMLSTFSQGIVISSFPKSVNLTFFLYPIVSHTLVHAVDRKKE